MAQLEHVNITVSNIEEMATTLKHIFGWEVRWRGQTSEGWPSMHVGSRESYIAMFQAPDAAPEDRERYATFGAMNHFGVVVDDLKATEASVRKAGFTPHAHFDYEPGSRFYFMGPDEIEIEVICYN